MIFKYIHINLFLFSLIFGLFCVYITGQDIKTIYIYPQPDNVSKIQYKDKADQCFEFSADEMTCPTMPFSTNTIPIQS